MEFLQNILQYGLPTGFVGAVVSWFAGRRQRNVDMLQQLQSSINLLSEENKKILAENVQLRKENAGLRVSQEELITEVAHLGKEIERLRKIINTLNRQLNRDETNQRTNNAVLIARGDYTRSDSVRDGKNRREKRGGRGDRRENGVDLRQCESGGDSAPLGADGGSAGERADGDEGACCGGVVDREGESGEPEGSA